MAESALIILDPSLRLLVEVAMAITPGVFELVVQKIDHAVEFFHACAFLTQEEVAAGIFGPVTECNLGARDVPNVVNGRSD
jgi:hypothetical protein